MDIWDHFERNWEILEPRLSRCRDPGEPVSLGDGTVGSAAPRVPPQSGNFRASLSSHQLDTA